MSKFSINFTNEQNKKEYCQAVLTWLESDFIIKNEPKNHFWNNKPTIFEHFTKCTALIALDDQKNFVGYMIWDIISPGRAEIDIIEVREEYRRKGAFTQMLSDFSSKFKDIVALSGRILPKAIQTFEALGWKRLGDKHVKILKVPLISLDKLTNGCMIAICQEDFYKVKANSGLYKKSMKYFEIDTDLKGKLRYPIIEKFHYEHYMAIYYNEIQIAEGKAKHLFKKSPADSDLLVIHTITPESVTFFDQDFFDHLQKDTNESPQKKQCLSLEPQVEQEPCLNLSPSINSSNFNVSKIDELAFGGGRGGNYQGSSHLFQSQGHHSSVFNNNNNQEPSMSREEIVNWLLSPENLAGTRKALLSLSNDTLTHLLEISQSFKKQRSNPSLFADQRFIHGQNPVSNDNNNQNEQSNNPPRFRSGSDSD